MPPNNVNPVNDLASLIRNSGHSFGGPSNLDMAKFILANSSIKFGAPGADNPLNPNKKGPGLLSRVVDILSRPNYAIANAVDSTINGDNPAVGLLRGLAGKDKTTFSDVLDDAGVDNSVVKGLGGFALDVALDPTTYIGAGTISKGLKGVGKLAGFGKEAAKELPTKPIAEAIKAQEIPAKKVIGRVASDSQRRLLNEISRTLPVAPNVKTIGKLSDLEKLTAESFTSKIPASKAKVAIDMPDSVNPGQQLSIFKNILNEAKNMHPTDIKRQFRTANDMMVHAENALEASGKTPVFWDGRSFKLSDILSEFSFGRDIKSSAQIIPTLEKELKKTNVRIKDPDVAQALDNVRVRQGLLNSPEVEHAINASIQDAKLLGAKVPTEDARLGRLMRSVPGLAARHGVEVPPTRANAAQNELLNKTAELVPSIVEKKKPIPKLSIHEQTAVKQLLRNIPKSKSQVNSRLADTINPHQQLFMWKHLYDYAKVLHARNPAKQFESAYQMLIHAEDTLELQGKSSRYWDGSNFKLSDMIAEMSTGKGIKFAREIMPQIEKELNKVNTRFKDPNIAQGFDNVRVRSAILDSPKVKEAINAVLGEKKAAEQSPISDARLKKLINSMPSLVERHAIDLGVSGAGASAAKEIVKNVIKEDTVKPIESIAKTSKSVAVPGADSGTSTLKSVLSIPEKDFKAPISGKGKVEEGIGARIFSWYGQKELRPITEQHLLTASNSSWLRSAALKRFADQFTDSQKLEAIRFAQGSSMRRTQLGMVFKQNIENLFRGSGLSDAVWKASSVAGRSELIMDRLNLHLKRVHAPWRFTNKSVKNPLTGVVSNYSGGSKWLESWQSWDVQNPTTFFPIIQGAVETATHEKAILDDIADRFGSKIAGNGFSETIDHPYLNGVHFTKDIAKQIPRVIKDMDEFFDGGANSPFVRTFDKISRAWKFSVTLPNPSHHIRNLLGDSYMNWMAGVTSIRPYNYALQILRSQKHNYQGLNDVEQLVNVGAIDRAMGKTPNAADVLFSNKSGNSFTAEQIYTAAHHMGILPQAHVIEDILGNDEPLIKGLSPFKGKLKAKLEAFSETREHFARLAHFTDIVRKSSGNNYQEIFRKAGFEVRKWHPDYLTLTPFEKKFLRRIMPFYSWTRRAIPLVIESAILNPGKTLVYPKAMQAIQDSMGIETPSRTDPFPTNQRFPEWIRDLGVGPIFDHPALGARGLTDIFGQNVGDTIVNPSNPTFDIGAEFSNPLQGLGGMLHPALKIPAELLTKTQIGTGAPINSDNFAEYLGNQIPLFSTFQGVAGVTPALGDTKRATKEGNVNTERIINWLTALGLRGTGPFIKQAQIEQGR